ncbi:MAG: LacI family DNA-binding transcriptional regulator [Sedimentisphaeraceae bacterium JB056]
MTDVNVNQELLAKELNISVGTVSKALRNYPDVSAKTKTKVLELAKKLGYRPYLSNMQFTEQKTDVKFVGVLTQTPFKNYSQIEYLSGMSAVSSELNVSQFVHNYTADTCYDVLDPALQPPMLRESMVSGLILVHRWPREIVKQLAARYTCVSIVHDYTDLGVSYVGLDNSGAISMLFDQLYKLGHREIGFIGKNKEQTWSMARFGGYCQSMAMYGLDICNENIFDCELKLLEDKSYDWEEYFDFDAIAARLESGVTAWMCSADWCAYNLFAAMKRRGYDVPADIAITGFDSAETTNLGCPQVTTVDVDSQLLGRRALRLLVDLIENRETGCCKVVHKCEYNKGASIAAPKTATVVC